MRNACSREDPPWARQWARHYDDIVRYAAYLLSGDLDTAEDVAQEVALRLWRHSAAFADVASPTGWLRTVTRNIVIDRSRRRRARPPEVALGPGIDREGPDEIADVDAVAAVDTLLADLSPKHRAAVVGVYVLDGTVVDVAARLGVPPGTVKSRCHTALRQLRAATPVVHPSPPVPPLGVSVGTPS